MGRGIVFRRKVYAGFEVRTQGTFPQGTRGWLWRYFWVWLCFGSVLFWSAVHQIMFFISQSFILFLSRLIVFKSLRES